MSIVDVGRDQSLAIRIISPSLWTWLLGAALTSPWNAIAIKSIQPVDIFVVLSLVAVLLHLVTNPNATMARLPRWTVVGCCGILLTGTIHATFGGATSGKMIELDRTFRWLTAACLLPWLAIMCARRRDSVADGLAKAWVLGVSVSGAVAVSDYFRLTSINQSLTGISASSLRQSGLTSQPNNVGLTCAMAMPFVLYFSHRRPIWIGVAFILAMAEIVSGSRAGQACFVIVSILSILGPLRDRRLLVKTLFALLALFSWVMFSPSIIHRFLPFIRSVSGNGTAQSNQGRAELARAAWDRFIRNPIFGDSMTQLTSGHSVPLQLLAAGGALLAAAFGAYLLGAVLEGIRLRHCSDGQLVTMAVLAHCAWISASLVSNALVDRYLYIPVAVVAVIWDTARRSENPNGTISTRLAG